MERKVGGILVAKTVKINKPEFFETHRVAGSLGVGSRAEKTGTFVHS